MHRDDIPSQITTAANAPTPGTPRRIWRYLPGIVTFVGGVALTVIMSAFAAHWDGERVQGRLREDADAQGDAIRRTVEAYVLEVEAIASFYHASRDDDVNRQEFCDFVSAGLARHPGIQALEWIPRVVDAHREQYEAAARVDGLADFEIRDQFGQGQMARSPQRPEYFPVHFVEPCRGNEAALGFDLASNPTRLSTLQLARDTGQSKATERIVLVQEKAGHYGFLVFCPVYRPGSPRNSADARRQNLLGFALGVFRIGDMLAAALARERSKGLDIHVYDESDGPDRRFLAAYSSADMSMRNSPLAEESALRAGPHVVTTIDVADRQWSVVHTPTTEYMAAAGGLQPWAVLAIGLLFTLSITTYSLVSAVRLSHIERLGDRLTHCNVRVKQETDSRLRAEAARDEGEQKFRMLFENAPALLVQHDRHGNVVEVNRRLEEITGWTREEIVGRHFLETAVLPASEAPKARQIHDQVMAGQRLDTPVELSIVRRDGRVTDIEVVAGPIYEDGTVAGVLVIVQDVGERKRAEETVRQSELRYRRIAAAVTDYIYSVTVDNDHAVNTVHGPGCVAVTGYSPEEFAADPFLWIQMVHEDDRQAVRDHAARVLVEHDVPQLEHRIMRKDGALRWVRNTVVPHCDEHGTLVSYDGLIKDVSEYKRLGEQLRFAQKMEAIGVLAGGVAHDFNNLLMGISGFTQLAEEQLPPDSAICDELKEVLDLADRAAMLNRQLLAFSRKQALEPVVLNLNGLVNDGAKMLRRLIGEDIDLSLTLATELGNVKADPGQMEQVLVNLVVNARDAMPRGGELNIQTANIDIGPDRRDLPPEIQAGPYVMLAVTDNGGGMDEATQARIFEPFFTTKERGKGTGLGLAMVYGIVNQHGGCITVESKLGVGTTFRVYLPQVAQDAAPAGRRAKTDGTSPRGREKILLVEDEEKVRLLISRTLSKLGYEVLPADSPPQAEDLFAQHGDRIALLLTDVVMPGGNGPDLFDRLVREHPHLKVLYMSGYADQAIMARGIIAPRAAFMRKPFPLEDLARQVREILDEPLSPSEQTPTEMHTVPLSQEKSA